MLRWGKGKSDEKPAETVAANAPMPGPGRGVSAAVQEGPVTASGLPELLLAEGKVTEAQLQAAMVKQIETGAFIGEILIADGVLDQDSLISFLAKHCKIPHLSLLDYLIDKEIVKILPEEICLRFRLVPIDKLGKNLTVAMVNPLDSEALEQVRAHCPELRIKPILCASNHFEIVIKRLFNIEDKGGPASLSASSLGLKMPSKKAAAPQPTDLPSATPAPSPPPVFAAAPAPSELPLPPLMDRVPDVAPVLHEEVEMPEAEEIPEVAPLPEPEPVSAPAATVLDNVFHAPPTPPVESPSKLEESGLGETSSMLMKEMATVMMDSMRDTYAVLARRMELFRGVPPEEVAKIFARGITSEFEEGGVIFEKGQPGQEMYVILGGEVIIRDGDRELARLGRGGMFGEMSLLSAQPRSASAIAADTTSVLALSNDTIRQSIPPHVAIQILTNVINTLSARLRQANTR